MDKAATFTALTQRQALRREAGLPPLDLPAEYRHAQQVAALREYDEFCDQQSDLRDRLRKSVVERLNRKHRRDITQSTGGRWLVEAQTTALFTDEIFRRFGKRRPQTPLRNQVTYGENRGG